MNSNIKNILVTRFNWPHPMWPNYTSSTYIDWLKDRIEMFAKFTVPSIRNCYIQPDDWFILLNVDVPIDIRGILTKLLGNLKYSFVLYEGRNLKDSVKAELLKYEYPLEVRMTRVDSDDLVASDFFARLKTLEFSGENYERPTVVSFPGGCNFVPEANLFFYSAYPNNPFLTLVEKILTPDEANTVYCRMHTELVSEDFNIRLMRSCHPMWASVIHDSTTENLSLLQTNHVLLENSKGLRARFGLTI